MAEKENNLIFDFTWGNTYGLFAEGYHIMIKDGGDLFLTWSVDLKYGETPLDNAKLDEFIKDLKVLKLDSWNGKTWSDSNFENADTWHIEVNHIALIMESKGANDYPPEWKQFLEYLHMKWSVPVSVREMPEEKRREIQKKKEDQVKNAEKKEAKKKPNNNATAAAGSGQAKEKTNRDRQTDRNNNRKKEQPVKNNSKRERPQQKPKPAKPAVNEEAASPEKSEKPRKFRYHRRRPQKNTASSE